jgi:hypothetical protein
MDDTAPSFDSDDLVDFLKFTAGAVDQAEEHLSGISTIRIPNSSRHETAVAVETALCYLATARNLLENIVRSHCPHCAACMNEYTDGRPVSTHLNFLEGSQWVHLWHPVPENPHNRPREVGTLTTRNGTRKRIVIAAPGHLDAFTVAER